MNGNIFVIGIVLIILISGCVESPTPKDLANNAIKQVQSFYKTVDIDLSNALIPVNEATSKGVETKSSGSLKSSLQEKLSNAINLLTMALSQYGAGDYSNAKSNAEQSFALMKEIEGQLGQINKAIENDYKTTSAKYKPMIIEAERQYYISQKYIEAANRVGADTSNLKGKLDRIMNTLNRVKESYNNNDFVGLSNNINNINTISQEGQSEATDLYYNAVIIDAIKKSESQITVQEAKSYLSEAKSSRERKKYPDAILSLNKALVTETYISILNNVNKLKQDIQIWGIDASFPSLDNKINSLRQHIASGNFDGSKQEIESIKIDVTTIAENAAKIADSNKLVEDTSKLNFWWAEKPDMKASYVKLAEAKIFLAQGDYKLVANTAQSTIDMATSERDKFWNRVKSDWLLGTFFNIAKLIKDPEKYDNKSVKIPQFEWKAIPGLIKIEFDKPIIDLNNIVIKDPGTPIPPTLKKSVNFELNPGNPTNCGTTITCRKTTATLKNTGDEDAHNVCVILEVYNGNGNIININGGSSLRRCIGDLSAGQSKSENVIIEADCGFLFSKCTARPFSMRSKVTSNERNFEFPSQQFS